MSESKIDTNARNQDYFITYLVKYLSDNKFHFTKETLSRIEFRAAEAAETYNKEILWTNTPLSAVEAAIGVLTSNIGESEISLICDVLEDNFSDIHSFETSGDIEQTAEEYISLIPDLFEDLPRTEFGISSLNIETTKTILTGRITEFTENHGI